jgi:hypothetical protein
MAGGPAISRPGLTIGQRRFDAPPAICFRGTCTSTNAPAAAPIADTCIFDRTASCSGGLGVGATTTAENGTKTAAGKWGWSARVGGIGGRRRGQSNSPDCDEAIVDLSTLCTRCESQSGRWRFALWVVCCMESWTQQLWERWPGASQGQMRCVVDGRDSVSRCRSSVPPWQRKMPCRRRWRCPMFRSLDRAGPQAISAARLLPGTAQRAWGVVRNCLRDPVQSWAVGHGTALLIARSTSGLLH